MSTKTVIKQEWTLASVALTDAYTDFVLSRQAMQCTSATLEFYYYSAEGFVSWLDQSGITEPSQITARQVQEYLAKLVGSGYADSSVNGNACAIKTLVRFWHEENICRSQSSLLCPRLPRSIYLS